MVSKVISKAIGFFKNQPIEISIHDPREKGQRPSRVNTIHGDFMDKQADKGLGLFIHTSSLEENHRVELVRNLLCAFEFPWLCFSVATGRKSVRDKLISSLPKQFEVVLPVGSVGVLSIICKHSVENVNALFELYNQKPRWFTWTFGVAYESSYQELLNKALSRGILIGWQELESADDGMKELMPYYIICDEDWHTIHVRCMDTELYDPLVKYAEKLIAKPTEK